MKKTVYLTQILLLLVTTSLFAQDRVVKGTVTDANDVPLPGATIRVKNTTIGTVTDIEGNFAITIPENEQNIIEITFIGFKSQAIDVTGKFNVNIKLQEDTQWLDEVVVTALGIKRETKKLAYAVQEVSGEELSEAKETNVVNSLSGKMAGVQVTGGNSGVGSSSQIIIRGENSLNPSPNANSPLFVVDGIIINNNINSVGNEGNMAVDFGNGAMDINPDDVETMTVLKGPNATALYGSRGANGVVLITTKSGKGTKGIGVSINHSSTFETLLTLPKYQNEYGQGSNGQFAFNDGGQNRSVTGGINDHVDESWGPALNGQLIPQHDSPTTSGFRAGDVNLRPRNADGSFADEIIATPFIAHPDNIEDFFKTGYTISNNVALTGANKDGNFRVSFTDLNSESIVPNSNFKRRTYALNGAYNLTDRLKVSASMNYINSNSDNRPVNSYGTENIMYLWVWFGRHIDMNSLRNYWQPGLENVQQFNYNYNYHDNPYFNVYENTNAFNRDRVITNMRLDMNLAQGLDLMIRTGLDYSNELDKRKRAYSTQRFPNGQYREDYTFAQEQNTDFLLAYTKNLNEDLDFGISVGANNRVTKNRYQRISANSLSIPGIYNFGNAAQPLTTSDYDSEFRVNSAYAFGNIAYKNYLFLDLTARNDWSSTLPENNNSYFYPSAGLSAILSDMFEMSQVISFAKFRAGYAVVGNDTNPYNLVATYGFGDTFNGFSRVYSPSELKNSNLKPEKTNSIELGADVRFFGNRLGIDLAVYQSVTKNQIIALPVSNTSGYSSRVINAGEIQNRGLEITLNATPIRTENFQWNSTVNFTTSRGTVKELTDGLDFYTIKSNYLTVGAKVGGRIGDLYGTGFQKVEDASSPHYGEWIIDPDSGLPIVDNTLRKLGNYTPDFMVGFQNSFQYRNFNFSFLFDWRQGGEFHSRTVAIGGTTGMLDFTVPGRETGIVAAGVIANADGSYKENTKSVAASNYYSHVYKRSNEESSMFSATYVKLRELKLGYNLPPKWFKNVSFNAATLSIVGRNLALWTENNHVDPETISFSGGTVIPGVEDMALPSTRSFGVNLNLEF
ncbi:SusC/RagA family TonB-linked outer membrane protein [Marivirga lumbricoides]|uniref:SusC/RagA family TonB-linked outer membrane protein n=1 Tax=Marivirga lumbricoides TaxID=1046115 RepID=A0ABQ1N3N9_9BACT|nr:SusC/RagA family TonB-linked outer membrane protein [Marivirga lumbricoides]